MAEALGSPSVLRAFRSESDSPQGNSLENLLGFSVQLDALALLRHTRPSDGPRVIVCKATRNGKVLAMQADNGPIVHSSCR
jgi:hypothetical protein